MKKLHFKTKLVLNSQTVRRLCPANLKDVQGGRPVDDSEVYCYTLQGCRNCG
jgi:hypothetical protein